MKAYDPRITSTVALLALAIWLGGLLALGAIVAPVVFAIVPRPEAADAMIVVFQRFDGIAVGAVIAILASEAWRARGARRIHRLDLARMLTAAAGAALVLAEAFWITPAIVTLHRAGALRGLDAAGLELDRMHSLAEACGKAQALLAAALVALHVVTLGRANTTAPSREPDASGGHDLEARPGKA